MGLERRGNRFYYYEKKRIDGKVVSVYRCGGEFALELEKLAKADRERKWARAEAVKAALAEEDTRLERFNAMLKPFDDLATALETACLLLGGYHRHHRQWRKKRNGRRQG